MATLVQRINDLAIAIQTKINSMMPMLMPSGGAIGSVLTKNSASDNDVVWAAPSGGAGAVIESATITVAPAQYGSATVTIVRAGVSPSSKINVWLAPNDEFEMDDLIGVTVYGAPSTDSIDVTLNENGPIVGSYLIHFTVS